MIKNIVKIIVGGLFLLFPSKKGLAQLSGIFTVPGSYTSVAAVINDLNLQGVNGAVTINIAAGYTETCTTLGYSLTATGTATSPIIFQKNGIGNNPIISAYTSGTATPSSPLQDGVWRFIGCDYVTIDGIDLVDPNTTNPQTMEFGYGFFKANPSDGCQNNTIKNCTITLQSVNNDIGTGMAWYGSRGIDVVNAVSGSHTTSLTVLSASGSNSNNKFYNNLITKCNTGISLMGFIDASPYLNGDWNNDIGGVSALTTNSIINYGGVITATNPATGINSLAQYSINISNNYIANNTGSSGNHAADIYGIYFNSVIDADIAITNNTVSVKGRPTSTLVAAVKGVSSSSLCNTFININNNIITNCISTKLFGGADILAVHNGANAGVLNINNNTISNFTASAGGGMRSCIYNTGSISATASTSNNYLNNIVINNGNVARIINHSGTVAGTLSINSNTIQSVPVADNLIYNISGGNLNSISNNVIKKVTFPTFLVGDNRYCIYNNNSAINQIISGNYIDSITKPQWYGTIFGYYNNMKSGANGFSQISNNHFSNFTISLGGFYGIYQCSDSTHIVSISSNTISNVKGFDKPSAGICLGRGFTGSAVINNLLINIHTGAGGSLYGVQIGDTMAVNDILVSTNTISALSCGGIVVAGVRLKKCYSAIITKNKINDIKYLSGVPFTPGAIGIDLTNEVSNNSAEISSNMIGNITAPTGFSQLGSVGICMNSSSSNAFFSVSYNTIFINGSSLSSDFYSAGIYQYVSTSPLVNFLELKNNIIIDKAIPTGALPIPISQPVAALMRSSSSLINYATTSNNNIFYAEPTNTACLLYYDGTNACKTLSAFTTLVSPRESLSLSEDTPFLTTVGTSINFLHVNPSVSSLAESNAQSIATYTNDIDLDIRQGNPGYSGTGTAPDIGADEFNQTSIPCLSPSSGTISPGSFSMCIGGTVSLTSSGFSSGLGTTYQWKVSNTSGGPYNNVTLGIDPTTPSYTTPTLMSGTYYYVLSTSCSATSLSAISNEATVTVIPNPTVSIISQVSPICANTIATLTVTGASTYSWNTGSTSNTVSVNTATAGLYTYSVIGISTSLCSHSSSISIIVNSLPFVNASYTSSVICLGQSTILYASGTANVTYSWSTGVTSSSIIISPTVTTNYIVTGTDGNGCKKSDIVNQVVSPCTSITETLQSLEIKIFPNPNNGEFIISIGSLSKNLSAEIYNPLGQLIKKVPLTEKNTRINLQDQSIGIYFIRLIENKLPIYSTKIIKE